MKYSCNKDWPDDLYDDVYKIPDSRDSIEGPQGRSWKEKMTFQNEKMGEKWAPHSSKLSEYIIMDPTHFKITRIYYNGPHTLQNYQNI